MTEETETPKVMSLYEKNPAIWDRIIKAGNPSIGELSKIMSRASQIDFALGMTNSAGKWNSGKSDPTTVMEARASAYIAGGYKPLPKAEKKESDAPAAKKTASEKGKVVLVVTISHLSKAEGIAAFLNSMDYCEVVEL